MMRNISWIFLLLLASAALTLGTETSSSFSECRVHVEAALNQYAARVSKASQEKQDDTSVTHEESSIEIETELPDTSSDVPLEATEPEATAKTEEETSEEVKVPEEHVEEHSAEEVSETTTTEAEAAETVPADASAEETTAEVESSEEAASTEEASTEAPEQTEETTADASGEAVDTSIAEESAESIEVVEGQPESIPEATSTEEPTDEAPAESKEEVEKSEPESEEQTSEGTAAEEVSAEETASEEATADHSGETGEEISSEEILEVDSPPSVAKPVESKLDKSKTDESEEDESKEDKDDDSEEDKSSEEDDDDKSEEDKDDKSEEDKDDKSEEDKDDKSEEKEDKSVEDKPAKSKDYDKRAKADKIDKDEDKSDEDSSEEDSREEADDDIKKVSKSDKDDDDDSDEDSGEEKEEPELEAVEDESEAMPAHLRPREHVDTLLGIDEMSSEINELVQQVARGTLKDLKKAYDSSIKPLEAVYKYRDISIRHLGDPELYSKSLIVILGPWGSGKSTFCNYLLGTEFSQRALKTGSQPGRGLFNVVEFGETEAVLDGTEVVAQWEFSSLQKFGQAFLQRLQGHRMPNRLLEKVTLVDMPGIIERGKQSERDYPFNDVCQWFIDRADLILVMFDPTRLDAGLEIEALFDQLKGREPQVRIVMNKADLVRPQDLMRVQGNLFWALSPLLGSTEPPIIYAGSFWSRLYRPGAPIRLFRAQEEALLLDIRDAFESRVENRIALTRRHAVRVRNHAKMVDCYLNTFYSHKSFFANKKKVAGEIVDNPQEYRIYEGISTLTNVSRYDLPDPDIYRDFFRLHPLYDFPTLHSTCTFFRGCPLDKLDVAISYVLPELLGKHRKLQEQALSKGRGQ